MRWRLCVHVQPWLRQGANFSLSVWGLGAVEWSVECRPLCCTMHGEWRTGLLPRPPPAAASLLLCSFFFLGSAQDELA